MDEDPATPAMRVCLEILLAEDAELRAIWSFIMRTLGIEF